ncbi:hypothetical protein [Effusibacillus pohliae]|uniref:hypothetical protein n=1 Tax=Effusibacillus pohliae TaxID=232270 RepID=UPI000375A3E6|nr:hypothetical protein [Effusibacillus pohliae]
MEPNEGLFLREILDNLSYVIDKANKANKPTTFIKKNRVLAGNNVIVATAPYRFEASAYYQRLGQEALLAGKTFTDWVLEQNKDETVADYDFFLIKDYTTIQGYNGWYGKKLKTDHDIPWDTDYILEWGPKDSSTSPYQVTFGYPFNVQLQFSMSSNPIVDEMGSQPYDYGRWEVYKNFGYINGDQFQPATTWKSYGTWADMDIREFGNFQRSDSAYGPADSSIKIDVSHDY